EAPKLEMPDIAIGLRPQKTRKNNLGEFRLDISRMTSDFDNGEALYRRAQQRINNMMTFVEQAEVDFALLDRLEPENRRLKAENRTMGSDLKSKSHALSIMESDLDEHRRRLAEVKAQYETSNANLSKAIKALADRDREITRISTELDNVTLKYERQVTANEVETRENTILRDRICSLSNDLDDLKAERATLSKVVESLKIDCEDQRNSKEVLQSESHDLRSALDSASKQNNQMKGEMVALHEEISTFKTQYEFNIISRDDRIFSLETQIEELDKQVALKEDIVANNARDIAELRKGRTAQELERERLEKAIDAQNQQLEDAHGQLVNSKDNIDELGRRHREVEHNLGLSQERADDLEKENKRLHEVESQIRELTSQLNIKDSLAARHSDQIASLTKARSDLERTLAVSEDRARTLEKSAALDTADYQAQLSQLRTDLGKTGENQAADYRAQIQDIKREYGELKTSLSIAEDRVLRAEEAKAYDNAKFQAQIKDLIQQVETRHLDDARDVSGYEAKILDLLSQNEALQTALDSSRQSEEENSENIANVSKYLNEINSLKEQLSIYKAVQETNHKASTNDPNTLAEYQKKIDALTAREKELERALAGEDNPSAQKDAERSEIIAKYEEKIAILTQQLDRKNELVSNAASDVSELRRVQTEQDEESTALKKQIAGKSRELDAALEELAHAKESMKTLDERYDNVAASLEETQSRRENNTPAEAPDIAPPPHLPPRPSEDKAMQERIMGYKLGKS
ncbi:MAG: hypothetical protein ACPGVT_03535, partial [Maricaulaceae bacterium]